MFFSVIFTSYCSSQKLFQTFFQQHFCKLKIGPIPASFIVYFRIFNMSQFKFKFKLIKAEMVCFGFEPGVSGFKAQTNPLSYGGIPSFL